MISYFQVITDLQKKYRRAYTFSHPRRLFGFDEWSLFIGSLLLWELGFLSSICWYYQYADIINMLIQLSYQLFILTEAIKNRQDNIPAVSLKDSMLYSSMKIIKYTIYSSYLYETVGTFLLSDIIIGRWLVHNFLNFKLYIQYHFSSTNVLKCIQQIIWRFAKHDHIN